MQSLRYCLSMLLLTLIVFGSGCGGPRRYKVRGTLTMDGKPISSAEISVFPEGGKGQPATTMSKQDGSFSLWTMYNHPDGEGVWSGQYKMTVKREEYPDPG